jgi:hypothetical protein
MSSDWKMIERGSQAVVIPFGPGLSSGRFLQFMFAIGFAVIVVTLLHFL